MPAELVIYRKKANEVLGNQEIDINKAKAEEEEKKEKKDTHPSGEN